ncbi:hypothetical protein FLCH110379_03890 [Flavobacterium chungbukense]
MRKKDQNMKNYYNSAMMCRVVVMQFIDLASK